MGRIDILLGLSYSFCSFAESSPSFCLECFALTVTQLLALLGVPLAVPAAVAALCHSPRWDKPFAMSYEHGCNDWV